MKYQLAIFDFDGTLADSFPFFIAVFNDLARRHGFKPVSPEHVDALRGYGARQLMGHLGLPAWRLPLVARDFIALMKNNCASIAPFEGAGEMLACLAQGGVRLAIVSSNSRANVAQVLGPQTMRHFSVTECGASIFGKAARLRRVLKTCGIEAKDAIYIGDQPTDLEAARAAGMASGAVAWGYGHAAALRSHAPDEEFGTIADLKRIAGPLAGARTA